MSAAEPTAPGVPAAPAPPPVLADARGAAWVERTFAAVAPRYDFMNRVISGGGDLRLRRRAARLAWPAVSGPLLDLATGTGDLAFALEREALRRGEAREILGLDFCAPMLELARAKAARRGSRVRFEAGDALRVARPDGAAALATIAFGLRNLADPAAGAREMYRLVAPGGTAAVLEFSLPAWEPAASLARFYLKRVLPVAGEVLAGRGEAYRYLGESIIAFAARYPVRELLAAAGLTGIVEHRFALGAVTLTVGQKPGAEREEPGA